jgi:septum formation protein
MSEKIFRLILASRSPRRREILKEGRFLCSIISSNSSELFDENLTLDGNLKNIAEGKVLAVLKRPSVRNQKDILVLGADTIVYCDGAVLGKPKNLRDAVRMLDLLSGKIHEVKTAMAIYCGKDQKMVTRVITTKVGFRILSKEDIKWYVSTGEPFDKAGAYGIQGLAQHFVNFVDGDLLNVIGLPLSAFREELRKHKWNVRTSRTIRKNKKSNR